MILPILLILIPAAILSYFWAGVLSDNTNWADARYCYGCLHGWCECEPGSAECIKQRNEASTAIYKSPCTGCEYYDTEEDRCTAMQCTGLPEDCTDPLPCEKE